MCKGEGTTSLSNRQVLGVAGKWGRLRLERGRGWQRQDHDPRRKGSGAAGEPWEGCEQVNCGYGPGTL